jgi:hypothetical protein
VTRCCVHVALGAALRTAREGDPQAGVRALAVLSCPLTRACPCMARAPRAPAAAGCAGNAPCGCCAHALTHARACARAHAGEHARACACAHAARCLHARACRQIRARLRMRTCGHTPTPAGEAPGPRAPRSRRCCPTRDPIAPPTLAMVRTCTGFPAAERRQQHARRQGKARRLTQVPWAESRRPLAQPAALPPRIGGGEFIQR